MVTEDPRYSKSLLQSDEWEKFQQNLGRKTRRISEKLVIRHGLPLGFNYLYTPRLSFDNEKDFIEFLEGAIGFAKKEKSIFFKIEPQEKIQNLKSKFKIHESRNLQPEKTLMLDLSKTEDILSSEMHQKTRYNVRLAEKHGVIIKRADMDGLEKFLALLKETSEREGFDLHAQKHYQNLLSIRTNNFWNEVFFAEYQGKTLAAAFINFYRPSNTATYLHGASSRHHKEVMAPHFLHWEITRYAKSIGFSCYDFWGIDEKRWPGVTRFKLGFGGKILEYPKTFDIVYRPFLYKIYKVAKKYYRIFN